MTVNCRFTFGQVEETLSKKVIFFSGRGRGQGGQVVYGDGLIFDLSLHLLHSF